MGPQLRHDLTVNHLERVNDHAVAEKNVWPRLGGAAPVQDGIKLDERAGAARIRSQSDGGIGGVIAVDITGAARV
jgi:hypothetical protein